MTQYMSNVNRVFRVVLLGIFGVATASAFGQTQTQKVFDSIKNMSGTWEGAGPGGQALQIIFKVIGGGSAVMSEIFAPGHEMVSMIHPDGPNRLLLTHYCTAGNQPRMQSSISADGKTITFTYVDATNLSSPDAGHMSRMVLTMLDENHHTEEWTYSDHGKEMKEVFDLHRKL